jgi:hypothetical protein
MPGGFPSLGGVCRPLTIVWKRPADLRGPPDVIFERDLSTAQIPCNQGNCILIEEGKRN